MVEQVLISKPCLAYEMGFDPSKLEKVELVQTFVGGTKKKRKSPVFDGKTGLESLMYVVERFNVAATHLEWIEGEEMFDNFQLVLADNAQQKWTKLADAVPDAEKTPERFKATIVLLYSKYAEDKNPRDTMFKYLSSIVKPRKRGAQEHADRMETLFNYSNELAGRVPVKNDEQIKIGIFESFPIKWQQSYNLSSRNLDDETLEQVVEYMSDYKVMKDSEEEARDNKRKSDNHGSQSNNKRPKILHNNKIKNPCRLHNGLHDWELCFDNPNGKNYKPGRRGFNGGRGNFNIGRGNLSGRGGRGYAGRGRTNGRGGNHFYNNNNGHNGGNHYNQGQQAPAGGYNQPNNQNGGRNGANMQSYFNDQVNFPAITTIRKLLAKSISKTKQMHTR